MSRLKSFGARLVTGVVYGAVLLVAVVFGGRYGLATVLAIACGFAAAEFYRFARREHRKPNEAFGVVAAVAMPLAAAAAGLAGLDAALAALAAAAVLWHLAFRQVTTSDTATTVFGAVYVGFTLSHLVLLQSLPAGSTLVLVTLVSVWAYDVFAYLIGTGIGRHKITPSISPNKSLEGTLGGIVCSLLVWIAAYSLEQARVLTLQPTGLSLAWHAALGLLVPVAALLGDLAESRFKREAEMKDSGTLLPGHGGFLDRLDSLTLAVLLVYYVVVVARLL